MGELSTYSQEAMDREVELLLNISTADKFDENNGAGPGQLSLNSTDWDYNYISTTRSPWSSWV